MNYTSIKVDDYWVIYSYEETKEGDLCYAKLANQLFTNVNPHLKSEDKVKVIACSKELNGLPVFVPEWENDDARWNAEKYVLSEFIDYGDLNEQATGQIYDACLDGYNTAKEKYQFTLEDMSKAFFKGYYLPTEDDFSGLNSDAEKAYHKLIESITKPKQYQVEIEQDCTLVGLGLEETCKPKITEGKITITNWKEL